MSQILAMSEKIREYEETIASLTRDPTATSVSRARTAEPSLPNHTYHAFDTAASSQAPALLNSTDDAFEYPAAEATSGSRKGMSDISLDERGMVLIMQLTNETLLTCLMQICYHGPTSAVHDPPTGSNYSQQSIVPPPSIGSSFGSVTSVQEARAIEQLALDNAAHWSGLPKTMLTELLQLYWSWIAPMFLWVYRPAFMRECIHLTLDYQAYSVEATWGLAASTAVNSYSALFVRTRRDFEPVILENY